MNKVVEYIIRAKDMTANAIKSALARFKSLGTGVDGTGQTARRTIAIMQSLSAASDMAGGAVGKVINGIKGVVGAAMTFGPVGAAVSAGMLAINYAVNLWAESQQKAIDKLNEWNARVRAATERRLGNYYKGLAEGLEAVASAAERAAASFERAAKARAALDAKREGMAAARGEAGLVAMRRDMAADVAEASDADKGRVAAAWRLKIAEEEARVAERAAKEREKTERNALDTAQKRLALARKAEEAAGREVEKLRDEYDRAVEVLGKDDPNTQKAKSLYEAAQKLEESARNDRLDRAEELKAAQGMAEVNAVNRANDVAKAYAAAQEAAYAYDDAERDYARSVEREAQERERAAQAAAAEEERERIAVERRIARERISLMRAELAERSREESAAQARLAEATARESQAWGWYRDRDSWAAQLQEERAEAEAQKQFDKDFDRLKFRHRDWRTSDRLSDEDELIRRVALAREEKAAAEEYAKATAEATQRAAEALEAIQNAMTEEA